MTVHRRLVVCKSNQNDNTGIRLLVVLFAVAAVAAALNSSSAQRVLLDLWTMHIRETSPDMSTVTNVAAAIFLGGIALQVGTKLSTKTPTENVAVVTMYPALGVQLSTEVHETTTASSKNSRPVVHSTHRRMFLPRDRIVDCIVYEVVLSHKVINVLAFRILPSLASFVEAPARDLRLIPAFSGTDMTYEECSYLRQEIMTSLELLDR